MQSSKEQQGKIRKPFSVINAKKQWKTVEWERLEISLRKLRDTKGTFHAKMGTIKFTQESSKLYQKKVVEA